MDRPDPDAGLVARAQQGDMAAFEMLVIKYQRRVERLIARMLRDVDLVADVAQDTFLRAYRALPNFRGESAFYTWLYRIAVNNARRSMARQQRDPTRTLTSLESGDPEAETFHADEGLTDGVTPESLLAGKELAQAVSDAVDGLAEDFRQALLLREVDGLSYDEIAEVLQCPPGTVRSRIYRAREAVAARLRPLLDTPAGRRW